METGVKGKNGCEEQKGLGGKRANAIRPYGRDDDVCKGVARVGLGILKHIRIGFRLRCGFTIQSQKHTVSWV